MGKLAMGSVVNHNLFISGWIFLDIIKLVCKDIDILEYFKIFISWNVMNCHNLFVLPFYQMVYDVINNFT